MLSPRWRKVLRDLWSNKTRTILVVLSIAVGVFAVGMISGSRGILRRDIDLLRQANFACVVLDEAQHIKNPDSQTARAAHRLRSAAKVAITGTPIENGVRDIWSIMAVSPSNVSLAPGHLLV